MFNLARVLAAREWRKAENIYYSLEICTVPVALPPPAAPSLTSSKQPSITQASLPPPEFSKGPGKAGDQG